MPCRIPKSVKPTRGKLLDLTLFLWGSGFVRFGGGRGCLFLETGLAGWKVFSNFWLLISILPGRPQCIFFHLFIHPTFIQHGFSARNSLGCWRYNNGHNWPDPVFRRDHRMSLSFGLGNSGHFTCVGVCGSMQMDSFPSSPGFPHNLTQAKIHTCVQWEPAVKEPRFEKRKNTQ